MDTAMTVVDVLRRIYMLRNAILRQRRVNRQTYVRMMEIYFVLQTSDDVVANDTMRRTAALEKFSEAVNGFWWYLKKYDRMCRVVRLFKFAAMEEERLKIVEEIDQLFRMLNLATAVTVMNSAADASRNTALLFANLENIRGDIKLTHDEILAAMFANKQRGDIFQTKPQEPILDRDVVDRVLVHQVSILSLHGALEAASPLHTVADSPRVLVSDNAMDETGWSVESDESEDSPAYTKTEFEPEPIAADVEAETRMQAVPEVELEDFNQATVHEEVDGEKKEPTIWQLTRVRDGSEEQTDESKPSYREEPVLIQSTVDNFVESEDTEEEEQESSCQTCALTQTTVEKVVGEEEDKGEVELHGQKQLLIRHSVDESIGGQEELQVEPSYEQLDAMVEGKEDQENDTSSEQPAATQDTADEVVEETEHEEVRVDYFVEVAEGNELSDNKSARMQVTTDDAIEPAENDSRDQQSRMAVDDNDTEEAEQTEKNMPNSPQVAPTKDTIDEMAEGEIEQNTEPSTEQSGAPVEVNSVEESEPSDHQVPLMHDATIDAIEERVQYTAGETVKEGKTEENESCPEQPEPMPICDQLEGKIGDDEDNEANSQRSASCSDTTTDESDEETENLSPNESATLDHYSVALFIQRLGSDDTTAQQKEGILMDLLRICITHSNRAQVYKSKGIPVLSNLVCSGETFFTQLYALHCLSWFTFSFSKMRESEFDELQRCVREPTHAEMLSLLHELQSDDDEVIERAALQCSCMATGGVVDALRRVGVLPLLIDLLKNGTTNQKLWATETLLTLASDNDENCVAITLGGAIPPLVVLLRTGTAMHKQEAAYALGNLAVNNEANRAKIAREGAIPPMVKFVKSVTDAQNQWAVYALGCLALNNEENRVLIAQEGAIRPLVDLLRTGKRGQKQWAAFTLGNLAHNDANREEITLEGAIAPLIQLLKSGTAMQKQRAAFALGNLACDNMAADFDDAILPLVDLVRMGSETQKEDAAYTLGNLAANNDARRAEIGRKGAIAPLVTLLKTGDGEQKQWAAFALRRLAYSNKSNQEAMMREGAMAPLTALMKEGTEGQKEEAAHALENLVVKSAASVNVFNSDRIKAQLMGYFNTEALSQRANVAATAALNTLGAVLEGVILDSDDENDSTSRHQGQDPSASPKQASNTRLVADAW